MSQSAPRSAVTPKATGRASAGSAPVAGQGTPQPAPKKAAAKKTAATKATPVKRTATKATPVKRATTKATPAKPAATKTTTARPAPTKAPAAKTPARKTPAARTAAAPAVPATPKPPARKTAAKKAPATKSPATKSPAKAATKAPAKPAARAGTVTPPAPAPALAPTPLREAAPVVEVEPPAPAVLEEVRRSWFTRRPLTFSRPDWADNWFEHGRPVTRLRTAIVVGPLMVGLVLAGGYGARMMYADPAPVSSPGPDVTCWDRTVAPAAQCTLPTGVKGLEWVYPTFDRHDDGCVDVLRAHPEYRRPTMWSCESDIHGRPLRITYSELTSVETGLAYHEKLFADGKRSAFPGPHGTVDHYVWRLPDPVDGMYRMASMYVDYPYAVLIEATTLRDRDRAYRDLVRQRDPRHISTRFS